MHIMIKGRLLEDCSNILIVVATYNEIENLPRLVERLTSLLPQSRILVIDDGSPDGTGRWCDDARKTCSQLDVIHRSGKLGLGSATLLGLQYGLDRGFDMVATMDADFSHDPNSLPDLIARLNDSKLAEFGVAIGSRYVKGGRIEGWPIFRRLVSRTVNTYARLMLRVPTKDNSGAFRVYRRSALTSIDLASVRSHGYGYLEEILWRLSKAGVRFVECPIVFKDRERGNSKTDLKTGFAVFWQITQMGLGRWK